MAALVCNCDATLTWRHVLHLRKVCCIVQFHLNDGEPVAMSIPATEHSVMTAWRTEREALENMIEQFGTGIFACVMDSYDYVEVSHSLSATLFSIYVTGSLLTSSSSTMQHQSAFQIHCSLSHIATHQPRSACTSLATCVSLLWPPVLCKQCSCWQQLAQHHRLAEACRLLQNICQQLLRSRWARVASWCSGLIQASQHLLHGNDVQEAFPNQTDLTCSCMHF